MERLSKQRRMSLNKLAFSMALTIALVAGPAAAHDLTMAKADVAAGPDDTVRIELSFDLHAWLLGLVPGHPLRGSSLLGLSLPDLETKLDEARARMLRELRIAADSAAVAAEDAAFPQALDLIRATPLDGAAPAAQTIIVTAKLPRGARQFTVAFPRTIGQVVLMAPGVLGGALTSQLLESGEASTPLAAASAGATSLGFIEVARRYLVLGFEHILPKGLDHILFVLALFFLNPRLKPLLWQVTAFTLAHSITLSLSVYGVFSLPSWVVEPAIALSIAFVAVENLFTTRLNPWRPLVVFSFGLLHGLGFASVLLDLGLPRSDFLTAVFAFNVGVELGQLSVIGLALLVVGWLTERTWYRARIAVPASLLIALTGMYWTVERIVSMT